MTSARLLDRSAKDARARELRRQMSQTEWRLWSRLRHRQLRNHKFRRQVPIGPYFADFACLEAQLVIEVDGDHHGDQRTYDRIRDQRLGEAGYRVLRFWVADIDDNIDGVLAAISEALSAPPSPGPSRASKNLPRCCE